MQAQQYHRHTIYPAPMISHSLEYDGFLNLDPYYSVLCNFETIQTRLSIGHLVIKSLKNTLIFPSLMNHECDLVELSKVAPPLHCQQSSWDHVKRTRVSLKFFKVPP